MSGIVSFFIKLLLRLPENPLKAAVRGIFYGNVVSERIVEYALCLKYLDTDPSLKVKFLDVGCYYSNFPIQLASMGYRVYAIDLQDFQLTHPNFTFIKGDINKKDLGKNRFDVVTCVSTLEHIGIGVYGDTPNERGDYLAVEKIFRILKKGGYVLLTVPFGVKNETTSQRIYDWESINELLKRFDITQLTFFAEKKGKWLPVSREVAEKVKSETKTKAIVFLKAEKRKQ